MEEKTTGKLYVCPTPIGNLEDVTLRVLRMLREADLIAAEDTRGTVKLLNHYEISTPMTSYHEHNKIKKGLELVKKMADGCVIALVSDAGMPGISDPGEELILMCRQNGIPVEVLPGATASVTALVLSGQPCRRFAFEGFLPKDKKERRKRLLAVAEEKRTIILYEAPHHLRDTLEELLSVIEPERPVSVCRELTKKHETCLGTTLAEAAETYRKEEPRGEFVLVIAGRSEEEEEQMEHALWEKLSFTEHMEKYADMDRKEAMRQVAKDRGISKRDVYRGLLEEEK